MALFYDVIFILYAAFQAPSFLLKGKHKEGWRERLGHIEPEVQCRLKDKRVVWFHAVSVGEVRLACRLMEALRKSLSGTPKEKSVFVLTTTTSSGKSVAQKSVSQEDVVLYVPLDWGPAVRRFLAGIHGPSFTRVSPASLDVVASAELLSFDLMSSIPRSRSTACK